jgi:hypothetical protein
MVNKNVLFQNREQEDKTVLSGWGVPVGSGEDIRKGCRKANMVEKLCIHVGKWKNETC